MTLGSNSPRCIRCGGQGDDFATPAELRIVSRKGMARTLRQIGDLTPRAAQVFFPYTASMSARTFGILVTAICGPRVENQPNSAFFCSSVTGGYLRSGEHSPPLGRDGKSNHQAISAGSPSKKSGMNT